MKEIIDVEELKKILAEAIEEALNKYFHNKQIDNIVNAQSEKQESNETNETISQDEEIDLSKITDENLDSEEARKGLQLILNELRQLNEMLKRAAKSSEDGEEEENTNKTVNSNHDLKQEKNVENPVKSESSSGPASYSSCAELEDLYTKPQRTPDGWVDLTRPAIKSMICSGKLRRRKFRGW